MNSTLLGQADVQDGSRRGWSRWLPIAVLVLVYLPFALTFSLLTRAYEADDEAAHTQYIEHIVRDGSIPHISVANGGESHQPPLYYVMAAGWQDLLGVPAFKPDLTPVANPFIPDHLVFSDHYSPPQHRSAVDLHELRLLSVLLGLGTVLLSYAAARTIGMRELRAVACGLLVALFPRELVIAGNVTNDALVIPLCALALVLFLLAERSRKEGRPGRRRLHLLGMGLVLGAAAATKFNSLPIAGLLLALAFVPSLKDLPINVFRRLGASSTSDSDDPDDPHSFGIDLRSVVDGLIAAVGFVAVSGWWFIRNKDLYGQFLATKASESYLKVFFAHQVPWNAHLLFVNVPNVFFETTWYAQPNLLLPKWTNIVLAVFGVLCVVAGFWCTLAKREFVASRLPLLSGFGLLSCFVGAIVAVVVQTKTTAIGDARVALVGISAFAVAAVAGSIKLASSINPRLAVVGVFIWPSAFFVIDLYVLFHFVVPLGGL